MCHWGLTSIFGRKSIDIDAAVMARLAGNREAAASAADYRKVFWYWKTFFSDCKPKISVFESRSTLEVQSDLKFTSSINLSLSLWPLKQCLKTDILCSNFYRREKKLIRSFYSYFKFTSKMISSYSNGNGRETKEIVCVRERACKVLERES